MAENSGVPQISIEITPSQVETISLGVQAGTSVETPRAYWEQYAQDIIVTQDATPTKEQTKIWFPATEPDDIVVPTYDEFEEATRDIAALQESVDGLTPTNAGTTGQILRKTADGCAWDNAATQEEVGAAVTAWLDANVPTGETVVVDNSLSVSGAAADAKKTGDELTAVNDEVDTLSDYHDDSYSVLDGEMNELLGLVNYGYDKQATLDSYTSYNFTVKRDKTKIYLNGNNSTYDARVQVCNKLSRVGSNSGVDGLTNGIYLKIGHRYRITLKKLSGTCTYNNADYAPYPVVYKRGAHASLGTLTRIGTDVAIREFVADNSEYIICMYIPDEMSFSNFACSYVMQDMEAVSIFDLQDTKAQAIERTIKDAAVASFTDGAGALPMEVTAEIALVQEGSGDATPLNIRPVIGKTSCTITRTHDVDRGYTASFTTGKYINESGSISSSPYFMYQTEYTPVIPNAEYALFVTYETISSSSNNGGMIVFYDENQAFITDGNGRYNAIPAENMSEPGTKSGTFTVPENARYIRFNVQPTGTNISIQPTKKTYLVSFPEDPGTMYGGTLTIQRDGTGVLYATFGAKNVNDASVSYNTSGTNPYFRFQMSGFTAAADTQAYMADYKYQGRGNSTWLGASLNNYCIGFQASNNYIGIRDDRYNDNSLYPEAADKVAAFKANLYDGLIIATLSSPKTYYFTAEQVKTLLGANRIYSNTGNISVAYSADTMLSIDHVDSTYAQKDSEKAASINALRAMIADEDEVTATENHASGEVFICGSNLYRATASIATGDTIAVGTNVEVMNLADYIQEVITSLTATTSDVTYLKGKVTDPDEAMSKKLYIQNGTCTHNYRTVTIRDGMINFVKESGGTSYKGIWITGDDFATSSVNLTSSKPGVESLLPISKLANAHYLRVHMDELTQTNGYVIFAISYCSVADDTVTEIRKDSVSANDGRDFMLPISIPTDTTHYALFVYSSTTNTCQFNIYPRFIMAPQAGS